MYLLELDQNQNFSSVTTFKCLNTFNNNLFIKELIGQDLALFGDFKGNSNFDIYFHSASYSESMNSSFLLRMGPSMVGVEESNQVSNNFLIYPNPSNGTFRYKGMNGNTTLSVFDMNGREVYHQVLNSIDEVIDLNLNSGVYLLKAHDETQLIGFKRIVILD